MARSAGVLKKEKAIRDNLTKEAKRDLYAIFLPKKTRERVGLTIQCPAYPQDPAVAKRDPALKIDSIDARWEPGISDGPTSARLAVVDYDGDTDTLAPPARWDEDANSFLNRSGNPLSGRDAASREFHQVSAWAIVKQILDMFEHGNGLGRPVPWAFGGNRLIIVPHAGYGENAFYDRASKSIQFYFYGSPHEPLYTCLSHDIVAHETGHAILDGIRPRYFERTSKETAAFHEFVGDLTAILSALANKTVRHHLAITLRGDLSDDQIIGHLAEQFGEYLHGSRERPFLRSAHNRLTMDDIRDEASPHHCSQVLTGAMFDFLKALANRYKNRNAGVTAKQALGNAYLRLPRMAIQPLDYCPPVDIRFLDYARAVVRAFTIHEPGDPNNYLQLLLDIFNARGLCSCTDAQHLQETCELRAGEPPEPDFRQTGGRVGSSRTAAYYFLDDNRRSFRIPYGQDIHIADVYGNSKLGRDGMRLRRETIVQYVWSEPVVLDEPRFGSLQGETVGLNCGGTVVLDDRGNLLAWFHKPGLQVEEDRAEGQARAEELKDFIAEHVRMRRIGFAGTSPAVFPEPPVTARRVEDRIVLETTPALRDTDDDEPGVEEWLTNL